MIQRMPFYKRLHGFSFLFRFDNTKQAGFGLVESLIAVAVLGTTVFMLVGSLTTGALSIGVVQEDIIAENIGRTQMEYTRSLVYQVAPHSYQTAPVTHNGYSATAEASAIAGKDNNIQKITVTVYHEGKRACVLEGFKVNR